VYIKFAARYVLMGIVIYIMMTYFAVPVVSLLSGLLALGAATMAEFLYESMSRTK
jgi:antibiotic biosynthesis monooxygenase (ABM) superfamily enzyme